MLRSRGRADAGFSLLEVMIAVSIMTVAFSAIMTSQSGSLLMAVKSRDMNIGGWLAHNKMVDSEHLMEGKPFAEIDKDPKIDTFDEPYARYKWKREIKELKFPEIFQAIGQKADGDGGVPEPVRLMSKAITNFLNKAMREMVITVSWPRGSGEQHVVLSTYLIDYNTEFTFDIQ